MAHKRARLTEEGAKATLGAGGILDRIGEPVATLEVRELSLAQIRPNPFQPRRQFNAQALDELATAMRIQGFHGHLLVRPHQRAYQLAYGERRLRAAKLAGLELIPVQVRDLTDQQMLEIALTENVLREDLHPVEEARGYLQLQETMGYSVREIGERIGKSKSYVATLLSLLRYPDLEEAVRSADIPVRTAEELAKIEDPALRQHFIAEVVEGKLTREQLIAALAHRESPPSVRSADKTIPVTSTISRVYRTLERQRSEQIPASEKAETIRLLQQIIVQASQLVEELEKGLP